MRHLPLRAQVDLAVSGFLVLVLSLAIVLVVARTAHAGSAEERAAARQAFAEGSKDYDLSEYAQALDAFKRAYRSYEDPVILYNIAQCHRALKHQAEAVESYRSYLRKAPNARNRQDVQHIIDEIESALASEKALSNLPPQGMFPSDGKPPAAVTAAAPDNGPAPTVTAASPLMIAEAPPPPRRRWLVPVIVVAAVVAVGLGVGLGVGLSSATSYPNATSSVVWK